MSNYVNIKNNSKQSLSIQLVPKNQASTIRFKNKPPLNYTTGEDGSVGFSLATTMIDRACIASTNIDTIIHVINGVEMGGGYLFGNANQTEPYPWVSEHVLGQIGIGSLFLNSYLIQNDVGHQAFSQCLYNLSTTGTIVLEGNNINIDNGPAKALSHKSNAYFGDTDLQSDSFIQDNAGYWGMALGTSDKPKGTQLYWNPPILDNDNTLLEGQIHLSLTLTSPGEDDIPLSHVVTVTRENTETPWVDAINWDVTTMEFITELNSQYLAITESPIPLFARSFDTRFGALYLFELAANGFDSSSAFLPMDMYDNADGSNDSGPSLPPPMMMAMNAEGDGEEPGPGPVPTTPNPFMDFGSVNIMIAGTPLISPSMMQSSKDNEYREEPDLLLDASVIPTLYDLKDTVLVVHVAVPETVTNPLITLAYDVYDSPLGKYGSECNDFRIASVGALKESLVDLYGPAPMVSEQPIPS